MSSGWVGEMAPFRGEVLMLLRGAGDPCGRWQQLPQRWQEGFPKRSGRFSCWTVSHSKPNIESTLWARQVGFKLFPFFFTEEFSGGVFLVGWFGFGGRYYLFIYLICYLFVICVFNSFFKWSYDFFCPIFSMYLLQKNGQSNLSYSFSCCFVSLTVTLPRKEVGTFSLKMYSLLAGITVLFWQCYCIMSVRVSRSYGNCQYNVKILAILINPNNSRDKNYSYGDVLYKRKG